MPRSQAASSPTPRTTALSYGYEETRRLLRVAVNVWVRRGELKQLAEKDWAELNEAIQATETSLAIEAEAAALDVERLAAALDSEGCLDSSGLVTFRTEDLPDIAAAYAKVEEDDWTAHVHPLTWQDGRKV